MLFPTELSSRKGEAEEIANLLLAICYFATRRLRLRASSILARISSKMSIEKFIDDQIKKAMDAGEFDNLPGKGKPIDLTAYFETPEDLRLAYSILKSNNFVPEEVEMLKEIEELKKRLESSSGETHQRLKKEISSKTYAFNMLIEKRRRR